MYRTLVVVILLVTLLSIAAPVHAITYGGLDGTPASKRRRIGSASRSIRMAPGCTARGR